VNPKGATMPFRKNVISLASQTGVNLLINSLQSEKSSYVPFLANAGKRHVARQEQIRAQIPEDQREEYGM
jgi:hypothetical protein